MICMTEDVNGSKNLTVSPKEPFISIENTYDGSDFTLY